MQFHLYLNQTDVTWVGKCNTDLIYKLTLTT